MAKDATAADPPASHIEKPVSSEEAVVSTQEDPKATGDRRSSVALNVIENPLTVGSYPLPVTPNCNCPPPR